MSIIFDKKNLHNRMMLVKHHAACTSGKVW